MTDDTGSVAGPATAPPAGAATLLIGQRIHPGREDDYVEWQKKLSVASARYPGFRGVEVRPPSGEQTDWVAVYQFDSVATMQKWLNSATRQDFLDRGADLFDGPGTQQVIAQDSKVDDTLVTVVVSHRVAPDQVEDFLAWQAAVDDEESRFTGFRGSEIFRPVEGVQDEWTISYKFDTAEHLDAWLTSDARQKLLSDDRFADFTLRRIDHSFGNWFDYGDSAAPPPSDFKTSIAVWMGLYPTVVLLTLLTAPLGMPLWLGMLVGNLLSSFVMSYVTMPFYGNPILRFWMSPAKNARQPVTNVKGFALVLAINAVWALIFYLVTVKFWTLP
ncbi:antibiotic biosynthesis monooxygenase [Mycolicibacterium sp. 050158]|uniref:antibiotic biosynthesis monooxygenase n=1 Tax=Mycolicibacterium sp. 050158 TaxID=3090602 RepID=UPI00299DE61F|nr:antibiotic biosynthesis monooxygenase [Mycolicibacterium sp. 050158]MDX1892784.1 antibiotic biosynthesis monooxygenase [Mycolicibacterium sp. 050158]